MNNVFKQLFGGNFKSPFERLLLVVCGASGSAFLLMWDLPDITWARSFVAIFDWVFIASIPLFGVSFTLLGVMFVGRNAGKQTFGAQARHTFGRVFLYIYFFRACY